MDERIKVLIAGGSGSIGRYLKKQLELAGYSVMLLSRNPKNKTSFNWDPQKGEIQEGALSWPNHIINLSGAGIADKRWTKGRKEELWNSRIQSTELLVSKIKEENPPQLETLINGSAIGYYNPSFGDAAVESDSPGNGFLARLCSEWESALDPLKASRVRVLRIRIGVVLMPRGGALEKMVQPIKLGIGSALGSGKQVMSWIHIRDICNSIIFLLENKHFEGAYNLVGPKPNTNEEFTKAIAKTLGRPLILPNVPPFALKLMLGEMASVVLDSIPVSAKKLRDSGYNFEFDELESALEDLLKLG